MQKTDRIFPKKIPLPFKIKQPVLAVGAQAKNTLCFAKGRFAYLSRLHPDLNNPEDLFNFERDAGYFLKKNPKRIASDLHPEYQSSKFALKLIELKAYSLKLIQHHHAHIASCMVENGLANQRVIGVAFDGTGLGSQEQLWGAEFLVCDYKSYQRRAHLREIPLLGAEQAIREPWRLSAFWLFQIRGERFLSIDRKKWQRLKKIYGFGQRRPNHGLPTYRAGFNSPLASSMGRLFDAVAALILAKQRVSFEAELAMELEKKALGYQLSAISYKFRIAKSQGIYILDPAPMFGEIVIDLKRKEAKEKIAYRFHLTVAEMVKKTCLILGRDTQIKRVVLSGGVFQNKLLTALSIRLLSGAGFGVFTHRELLPGDSSISLGQAVIANFRS